MKKFFLIAIAAIGFSSATLAQGGTALSIGAELALPMGDFNQTHKLGLGGSAKVAFPIFTDGAVTVSAGYISFSGKDFPGFGKLPAANLIPLKAGLRYSFPTAGGFYIEPQLGYSIIGSKGGESTGAFTYAGNVGILIQNMIDLAVRYEGASRDGATLSHIGLRAAYSFNLGGK